MSQVRDANDVLKEGKDLLSEITEEPFMQGENRIQTKDINPVSLQVPISQKPEKKRTQILETEPDILTRSRQRLKTCLVENFVESSLNRMTRRAKGEEQPIPLPWPQMAQKLNGGLWPGLHILVGETGTGKSQFALQAAHHAASQGVPVLYIGLELEKESIIARLAGLETKQAWNRIYLGQCTPSSYGTTRYENTPEGGMQEVRDILKDKPWRKRFHAYFGEPMGWDYQELLSLAQAVRLEYPEEETKPGSMPFLIVLDFLQIVSSGERREDLRERIGRASYTARAAAREFGAAILLVSSTSRDNGKAFFRKEEQHPNSFVGMGKESGEIEFSADTVLALLRDPKGGFPAPISLAIAKQRAGIPTWCDNLWFDGNRFTEGEERLIKNQTPRRKLQTENDNLKQRVATLEASSETEQSKTAIYQKNRKTRSKQ